MKHAVAALAALAMGVGIIAAAEARGLQQQSNAPANNMQSAQQRQIQQDEQAVRQAQQQLKAQGLYEGEVDGIFGPQTRQALSRYQQRSGLPQTATLDQATLKHLMGGQADQGVGVGTSTPPQNSNAPATPMPSPNAGNGAQRY